MWEPTTLSNLHDHLTSSGWDGLVHRGQGSASFYSDEGKLIACAKQGAKGLLVWWHTPPVARPAWILAFDACTGVRAQDVSLTSIEGATRFATVKAAHIAASRIRDEQGRHPDVVGLEQARIAEEEFRACRL